MSPLWVTATGCGVVFSVLTCIALCMWGIGAWDSRAQRKPKAEPQETVDPLTLVLISAAVAAVVKKPVKIYRVRPWQPDRWSEDGRREALQPRALRDLWGKR